MAWGTTRETCVPEICLSKAGNHALESSWLQGISQRVPIFSH